MIAASNYNFEQCHFNFGLTLRGFECKSKKKPDCLNVIKMLLRKNITQKMAAEMMGF